MKQNLASTLEQPLSGKAAKNRNTALNNALLLTAGVCLALNARNPHPRSPAHAVQHIHRETGFIDEPAVLWVQRFFNMHCGDYSIRWDWHQCDWRTDGDQCVGALTIAEDCVYWMQHQWDFATHEIDDRFEYTDCWSLEMRDKGLKELSHWKSGNFILPAQGEMVRRVWRSVCGESLRMLDIWESLTEGKYHYAIRQQGSPEILARSIAPYYPHVLCKLVEEELAPSYVSEPFIIKIKEQKI
jgi:hypothetical protein